MGVPNDLRSALGRLARESRRDGSPERAAQARREVNELRLEQAVRDAIAAAPPMSSEARDRIARLLTVGGDAA